MKDPFSIKRPMYIVLILMVLYAGWSICNTIWPHNPIFNILQVLSVWGSVGCLMWISSTMGKYYRSRLDARDEDIFRSEEMIRKMISEIEYWRERDGKNKLS